MDGIVLNPATLPDGAKDFLFDVPSEVILATLGMNYNAVLRTWLLQHYQSQLDHHRMMTQYYKSLILKIEELEIKYETEPELPVSPAAKQGEPIKLSDLAKQRPVGPKVVNLASLKNEAAGTSRAPVKETKTANTTPNPGVLSTSLAAKEVQFTKKPTKVNMEDVEVDPDNQTQQFTHLKKPAVKRAANNHRSDIQNTDLVKQDKEEDDVTTWMENPNAFAEKKESKLSKFGGLFGKKDDTNPSPAPTSTPAPSSPSSYGQGPATSINTAYNNNGYNTSSIYNTNPVKPSVNIPPMPPSQPSNNPTPPAPPPIPPTPTSSGSFQSNFGNTSSPSNGPLMIPKPPQGGLHYNNGSGR